MLIKVLRSKIHRATVTEAELEYVGSITIDKELMDAVGIVPGEEVLVADLDNGSRLVTYVLEGQPGSGIICLNGAAARLVHVGDKVIIMSFAYLTPDEAKQHEPGIILVDDKNRIWKHL